MGTARDIDLVRIGQGTWQMEGDDRRTVLRALRHGLDLGLTHIDTAELYGHGEVERLVGEAIAGRRDEVVLVSKILPEHASRSGTRRACEGTLRRLRTDRLDGYLLHWLGPHPLAETAEAMEALVDDGLVDWWGVSNFDEVKLAELLAVAGEGRVACNQVLYHLRERSVEHAVIPFCRARGIAVVGYSPFGSGDFPDPSSPAGRVLAEVAAEVGGTPRQVALAFLTREPGLYTIPKASRPEHVEENAGAGATTLTPAQIEALDRAFPRGPRRWGVPTL